MSERFMAFDAYSLACRRIGKLSDNWHVNLLEAKVGGVLCTGAVSPPYERGPRKGEPNWSKRDRATVASVIVTAEAYDAARSDIQAAGGDRG